jgi:hypothetical protein
MPTPAPATAASVTLRGYAYPRWGRLVVGSLSTLSAASLPAIFLLVLLASDPPVTPPVLVRLFGLFFLLPALAAAALRRALAAEVEMRGDDLVVRRGDLVLEIPRHAIGRVAPWTLPVPDPGVALWMRSGRRLGYGLATADPVPLVEALGDPEAAGRASLVYARARAAEPRWRWYHYAAKYVLFALGPAGALFYTHQWIAYGGPLGQYYLLGAGPYLLTFAVHWVTVAIYLVLWASLWRGAGEVTAWVAAAVAPSRAARVRRAVEITCRIAFYAGVPGLLLLRYLPWD